MRISLVTIPVRVYTALNTAASGQFHQLHRDCHQRVRQKLHCPVHGEISRDEIVKGYEFDKDNYVVMEDADFQKVRLETTHTLEIVQFVDPDELDPVYLDAPYFVGPENRIALESYCILHEAIQRTGLFGIGRVVLNGREKPLVLKPAGRGLMFTTLRSAAEVRTAESVFHDLVPPKLEAEQVDLAQKLIAHKTGKFDPASLTDRYQSALMDLIQTKIKGVEPVIAPPAPAENVVDLMEALRQSIASAQKARKSRPARAKIAA